MSSRKNKIPRGIRNNNPLNIRVGNNWKGEVSHPTDHAFEQFTDMKWGVRAAFIVLRNYIIRHRCNTIKKIIPRWAPNSDNNNTAAYIRTVCDRTRYDENKVIDPNSTTQMCNLFCAMCFVENGKEIDIDDVVNGWLLVFKK